MNTYITPDYIRHTYKVSSELKSYTVYSLVKTTAKVQLPETLRIETYQNKSLTTGVEKCLRFKTSTSWDKSKQLYTGLRPIHIKNVFYGDVKEPKKTLLIIFYNNLNELIVDYYRGFYPFNNGVLQNILNKY
jgi:hypothetical protein